MSVGKLLSNIAVDTCTCAAAGSLVGPLGAAGGAIAGSISSTSRAIIGHLTHRAVKNATRNGERGTAETHQTVGTALSIAAFVGSFFAAAAIAGVSLSIGQLATTVLVSCLISLPILYTINFLRDSCLPASRAV